MTKTNKIRDDGVAKGGCRATWVTPSLGKKKVKQLIKI